MITSLLEDGCIVNSGSNGIIYGDVLNFHLVNESDFIRWKLGKNHSFSVKSIYDGLSSSEQGLYHKVIWKGKIPAEIKIFLWLLSNNAIITKENLRKRNWQGDPRCMLCDDIETISYLFFLCPVAKVI